MISNDTLFAMVTPGGYFTQGLWTYDKFYTNHIAVTWNMIIRSGHNFAHIMTAELSWYVQICDLMNSLKLWLKQGWFLQDFSYELINQFALVTPGRHSQVQPKHKCHVSSWITHNASWWRKQEPRYHSSHGLKHGYMTEHFLLTLWCHEL